jgi:hypothetical protein
VFSEGEKNEYKFSVLGLCLECKVGLHTDLYFRIFHTEVNF